VTVSPIQPQDHRPPAKRATASSKKRKQAAMDGEFFAIRVDGVDYVLNPNDITGAVEYKFRRELGMGLAEYAMAAQDSPGVDQVGALMWACRMAHGEDIELLDVLETISMGSSIEEIEDATPAPKASGKNS
jgi:hypothetical protein